MKKNNFLFPGQIVIFAISSSKITFRNLSQPFARFPFPKMAIFAKVIFSAVDIPPPLLLTVVMASLGVPVPYKGGGGGQYKRTDPQT